jgi:hypothetical protein
MMSPIVQVSFVVFAMPVASEAEKVEVVLAHHDEDLSWLQRLPEHVHISIYTKGAQVDLNNPFVSKASIQHVPNVGRETHTYLHHIVQNYERLADWTVFSQAGEPSFGYKGHRSGGGHLMAGDDFAKYLVPHSSGARFVYTSVVHLPSTNHLLRAAYCIDDEMLEGGAAKTCPTQASYWTPWWDIGDVMKNYIASKVESQHGEQIMDFYHKYINPAHTGDEVIAFFPQGARFAVSRETIHRRPKVDYELLLATVSKDVDPYAGYFMEWLWSELFLGHQEPCVAPPKVPATTHFEAMETINHRFPESVARQEQHLNGVTPMVSTTSTPAASTTTSMETTTIAYVTQPTTMQPFFEVNVAQSTNGDYARWRLHQSSPPFMTTTPDAAEIEALMRTWHSLQMATMTTTPEAATIDAKTTGLTVSLARSTMPTVTTTAEAATADVMEVGIEADMQATLTTVPHYQCCDGWC